MSEGGRMFWQMEAHPPLLLFYFIYLVMIRYLLLSFIGSISFAMSDTIATEIGMLSKAKPRSILTGKEIDIGMSGGITIQGEIAFRVQS